MISWMTDSVKFIPASTGTSAQMEVFRYWNSKVRVTLHTRCSQNTACHIQIADCSWKHGMHIADCSWIADCALQRWIFSTPHHSQTSLQYQYQFNRDGKHSHYDFILIMLLSWMSAQNLSQGQSRWLYGCWLSTSTYMIVCKCWSSVPFHAPTSLPRSNQKDKRKPKGTGGKHGKVQEPTFYWPKSMVQHMDHYTACFQVPNRYITK